MAKKEFDRMDNLGVVSWGSDGEYLLHKGGRMTILRIGGPGIGWTKKDLVTNLEHKILVPIEFMS